MDRWTRATAASLAGALALFQPVMGVASAASAGGKPSQVTSSAPSGNADFDPRALPALPQASGSGDLVPTLRGVVLDGSSTLSTSLTPRLSDPNAPDGAQVRYEIRSFADKVLWTSTTTAPYAKVPQGVLRDGGSYTWSARYDGRTSPSRLIEVDVQRVSTQRTISYGDVAVTSVTGEPVFSAGTVALGALPGTAGVTLVYQPSNGTSVAPTPGVPGGWRMDSGAGWDRVHRYTPSRLELSDSRGRTITFTRTGAGVWVPRFGPGRTWPQGTWVSLSEGAQGRELTATDRSGTVTTFPMPTEARPTSRATSAWAAAQPGFTRAYDTAGRLTSITDPASSRSVTLAYGGSVTCPAPPVGGGFIAAPTGLLCAVVGWGGQRAEVAYSGSAGSPRIARITTQAQAAPQLLGQTDIGYDSVGRLASVRVPQTNRAVAAGVLNGFGPGNAADPRLLTTISYDARGRVVRVQRPSAVISGSSAAPPPRGERRFEYPAEGTIRVVVPGRAQPAWTHVATPATMLETRSVDSVGRVTTQSWDTARQVVTEARLPGGKVKRFTYDALGNARTVVGPTTTPDSSQAPRMTYGYDTKPVCPAVRSAAGRARENSTTISTRCTRRGKRVIARRKAPPRPITSNERPATRAVSVTGPISEAMKGFQTTYWSNREFSGTPAGHSTGPVTGAAVPTTLRFSWSASPTGTAAWSGRLQGFLVPPATGRYTVSTGNGAQLVLGDEICRPSCAVDLQATRPIPVRVDVTSGGAGGGGVDITWKGPAGSGPVPIAAIRPGYPNPTQVAALDDLGSGLGDLESLYVFDPANPAQVVESVSPSGAVQVRAYEPFNPAAGSFGRATTSVLAPGRERTVSYYGGTEKAAAADACRDRGIGGESMVQGGAGRTMSLTGGFSTTAVVDDASRIVSQQQALSGASVTTRCNAYDDAGNMTRTLVPGADPADDVEQRYELNVNGNPLVVRTTSRTGSDTRTSTAIVDLLGRTVSATDGWGTVTVTSYDELDRAVYVRSTTQRGEATETRVTFTDDSQIRTITVDGRLMATVDYAASTGDLVGVTYANGARFSKSLGANLDPTERRFTVGGATMRETFRTAPSGRVLDRTMSAPGISGSWRYRYDRDSRLTGATLSGSALPVGVAAGTFSYAFDEQSRRTRIVAPGRDVSFAYDGPTGRMTSTTDPRFPGAFEYDSRGRASAVGPLRFTYGGSGQVQQVTDTASQVSVANILDGAGIIGQVITGPGGQGGTVHYSAQGLLLRADGSVASRMVPLPGGVSAQVTPGGSSTWRYADGLGNVAWEATDRAAPSTTSVFDPDGNRLGTASAPSLDPTRPDLGWTGAGGTVTMPLSVAAMQMGSRTYVPALATFLQPDPVPGGAATPYAYVPDPINASDSAGALPEWASTLIKVSVATAVSLVIMKYTAGTGALTAKVAFQNIMAGALAGATGEASSQGVAIGVDSAIDGSIEEHNEWSWDTLAIAAASGAGAEVGGAAVAAWGARAKSGIAKAADDAFDEALSGLSATDDMISGAGLTVVNKADDSSNFVMNNVDQLNEIGVPKEVINQHRHAGVQANQVDDEFEEVFTDGTMLVNGKPMNWADFDELTSGLTRLKR